MPGYIYESDFAMPVGVEADTVLSALTQSEALTAWFAEYADVSTTVGGAFRFWGRFTYEQPVESTANQTLVDIAPDGLAFSWFLLNQETIVRWRVSQERKDDSEAVILHVKHEFGSLPAMTRAEGLIDDLWRIHMGSLCSYLRGEEEIFRIDFSDSSPVVQSSIIIKASRGRVFAALIEPEQIKQWFPAPSPIVDPRVGGDYGFGFSFEHDGRTVEPPPMKILEFVENERLTITWPDWRMDPSVPDQTVTWLLEERGESTRLTLIHQGFARAVDVSDYPFGWRNFLNKIRQVAVSTLGT